PKLYFDLADKVCQLKARAKVTTPFPDSIFTTAKISFGDVPNLSRKNWDATFYGLEAVTSFGHYDWRKRGGFVSWDDNRVIPLRPGATVIFPAGMKRFSFVPVAPNETRFLFRQYCHAGALRWVEKDGRSDAEFEAEASAAEAEAWDVKRAHRGKIAAQMYSKIGDIYVF
ncbi:hypothetical protein B0H13DRAFT_1624307, partial [Mycena leptocephala]